MWNPYDAWQKYRVTDVATLEEFLDRYYRHDRYKGRGEEYAACVLASHRAELEEHGCDWIGQYESITGRVVSFYQPTVG